MSFENELSAVLPSDLPERRVLITKAAAHLSLIEEANRTFNLTRISGEREAAIKHVLDSVMPWRLFSEGRTGEARSECRNVLDAGTGAGFPGIPLAVSLSGIHFTLCESTQKKARFVESVVAQLELKNVEVTSDRAEELVRETRFDVITARALAPISRALAFFGPALKKGTRLLLYKGPDVAQEMADAAIDARKRKLAMEIVLRYELPDALGSRTIVEIAAAGE